MEDTCYQGAKEAEQSYQTDKQEMRNKNDMNDILKGHVTMVEESQQSKRASESNLYVVPFGR